MATNSSDRPPPYSSMPNLNQQFQGLGLGNASEPSVHKIVVGVDFGTTFTGISWVSTDGAHVKVLDDVHCIRDWPGPGRDGDYSWKAPSRIAIASENGLTVNAWGYEVTPRMKSYAWMKLLLDPEQATRFDDPHLFESEGAGVLSKPFNKSAVDICADFLTEVATFAYQSLSRRVSPELLEASPIDFWFTVPAVWSDRAKADTLRAAQKAAQKSGIHWHPDSQVFLVREPEAAAIATLSALTQGGSEQYVKTGDAILVCDCGGGTVDITTYNITGITPKLTFEELVVGDGGKCGSTYIDREFIRWMEDKFQSAYTDLPWEKRGPASRLMKDFEGIKRDFGKSNDPLRVYEAQVYMRNAEDSQYYDADDGIVTLHQQDLQAMFDKVIEKIIDLLDSQLSAVRRQTGQVTIKTVLLVGGFGDSAYLNDVLRGWCQEYDIRLLCPEHPQSAIVRGAALSGLLDIQPSSRRSRVHYGFACAEDFDRLRHREQDAFYARWDGRKRAGGNMRWKLNKGDIVDESTNIQFNMNYYVDEDDLEEYETCLYYSTADESPLFRREDAVKKLATIRLKFDNADLSNFPSRMVDGGLLRKISCQYTVQFGHRRGVLCFSATVNGTEVGNMTVTFDGQGGQDIPGGHGDDDGEYTPPCAMQ